MSNMAIYLPNGASRVTVCVNSKEHCELQGCWYNAYLPSPVAFATVIDLLAGLECFYNSLAYPQSSVSLRCFGSRLKTGRSSQQRKKVTRYMSDEQFAAERGEKATFVVQVQFRQNATWQGTVTWAEKNQTCHFRSALELLKLMDETLSAPEQTEEKTAW